MNTRKVYRFSGLISAFILASVKLDAQQPRPVPAAYPVNTQVSYVRTWAATAPEQDANALMTKLLKDVKQSTQYSDGLGRPLQTVVKQGSMVTGSSAVDMVSPVEYDIFDREPHKYLPFAANNTDGNTSINDGAFKLNPFAQQATFMNALYGAQGETYYYSKTNFEASPANKAIETYAPGNSWVGSESNGDPNQRRFTQVKTFTNTVTDAVRIWTVNNSSTIGQFGTYSSTSSYPAGELSKLIAIDEHKKQIIVFKDKLGNTVLKKVQLTATPDDGTGTDYTNWICTYYIYDDLGNLRCVIQPEGVKALVGNWNLTNTILDEQCFRYEYDSRERMIMKKIPGAGEVYMVYDKLDRLVMTQDANMRMGTVKWMVLKYDVLNRSTETGLWTDNTPFVTHLSSSASSTNYPTTSSGYELLTLFHYDDYNNLPVGFLGSYITNWDGYFSASSNTQWPYPQMPVKSNDVKGLPTWTQIKVLGTLSTYLYTCSFYDDKGKIIQVQSTNITGGIDVLTTQYNWAGQPLVLVQKHEKSGGSTQTTVFVTAFTYDELGRVTKIEKKLSNTQVNNGDMSAFKTIAQNTYDELGQLKVKKLGTKPNTSTELENLNCEYNIRGWMLGANREYAKDATNNNYFGFDLGYDKANNGIIGNSSYVTPQYNGNIEGMVWKSKGDGEKRKYDFTYDAANRLMKADFTQYTGGTFNLTALVDFSVKMGDGNPANNNAYDANGNINWMQQWGLKINQSSQIDDLHYTYQTGSNRLKLVIDYSNLSDSKLGDFKYDPTFKTSEDYAYDPNGNLITDNNKRIIANTGGDGIRYNHLNLPKYINVDNKGSITYTYDAAGNKLKKETFENPSTANGNHSISTTTTYINGFVYESRTTTPTDPDSPDYTDKLLFTGHEEGRIRFKPAVGSSAASFEYDYMLKDHLGNVRMVLTEEQKQDIYPAATLEDATYNGGTAVSVENLYYTIDNTKIVNKSAVTGITDYYNHNGNPPANNNPYSNPSVYSDKLYKLNSNSNKTGLGITLKVMSGDKIDVFGKSYYFDVVNQSTGYNPLPILDLLASFLNAPNAGSTVGTHGTVSPSQINTSAGTNVINSMITQQNNQSSSYQNRPRAFINVIFFDEQFKAVDYKISMVGNNSQLKEDHYTDLQNLTAPKNGFVYIYCSNETPVDVFFDNLQVIHTRGAILEETHYYPFGLTMAGISSKMAGSLENKRKFNAGSELQSREFSDGSGLELYATQFRSLDPQIGRFWQIDPKPNHDLSPYATFNNNPIRYNDPLGDTVKPTFSNKQIKALQSYFDNNAKKIEKKDDCITCHNKGMKILTNKPNLKTGSQADQTRRKMQNSGDAGPTSTFGFKDANNAKATTPGQVKTMDGSVGQHIANVSAPSIPSGEVDNITTVFGISIMEGYHTMTLTYSKISVFLGAELPKTIEFFTLHDQGTFAGTDGVGTKVFSSAADLDAHLTNYVMGRAGSRTINNSEYKAKIEVHQILNNEE